MIFLAKNKISINFGGEWWVGDLSRPENAKELMGDLFSAINQINQVVTHNYN